MKKVSLLVFILLLTTSCFPSPDAIPRMRTAPIATLTNIYNSTVSTITHLPITTPLGTSRIPKGKYLFVELWIDVDNSGICPRSYVDFPNYAYTSGKLQLQSDLVTSEKDFDVIKGFFGHGQSFSRNAGSGAFSELQKILDFPFYDTFSPMFVPKSTSVVILDVTSEGAIVAQIDGRGTTLQPGQSWKDRIQTSVTVECNKIITTQLTNYGLLERSQLKN